VNNRNLTSLLLAFFQLPYLLLKSQEVDLIMESNTRSKTDSLEFLFCIILRSYRWFKSGVIHEFMQPLVTFIWTTFTYATVSPRPPTLRVSCPRNPLPASQIAQTISPDISSFFALIRSSFWSAFEANYQKYRGLGGILALRISRQESHKN
jgi:hypothetical protein